MLSSLEQVIIFPRYDDGDILVYDAAGELSKNLAAGGTFENNYINFANTGGMILGAATQDAGNFRPGSIQLMGGGDLINSFRDPYTGNVVRRIGTFILTKLRVTMFTFKFKVATQAVISTPTPTLLTSQLRKR